MEANNHTTDTVEETKQSQDTEVMLTIPNTDELGKLEGAKPGFNMVPKYWTQEEWAQRKGKPIRCFYLGMKQIPNSDGESVNCAIFSTASEVFLAAQMVLVEAVARLPKRTAVQITYEGRKKNTSSDGSTNLFDVVTLNIES